MTRIGMELGRLCAEHQQMHSLSERLRRVMDQRGQFCAAELQPVWQEFHTILTRHLKCEDWVLYPKLSMDDDRAMVDLAIDIFSEVGGVSAQLAEFDAAWDAAARDADPQGYQQAIRAILDAVDHRTICEENRLFPAAQAAELARAEGRDAALGVDLMPSLA